MDEQAPSADDSNQPLDLLRPSRDFLYNVINAIPDPFFVKDAAHRLILVNDAYCSFYGLQRQRIIGRTERDFAASESVEIFWKNDDEVMNSGRELHYEVPIRNIAGSVRTLSVKKSRYEGSDGNRYVVGITRDITDIKQAQAEKSRAEELRRINDIMVGREEKMIELKRELSELKKRLAEAGIPE